MKKNIFLLGLSAILITACGTDSRPDASDLPPSESGIRLSIACFEATEDNRLETGEPTDEDPLASFTSAYIARCYVHTVDANSDPVSGLTYDISVVSNVKVAGDRTGTILTTDPITFTDNSGNFIRDDVKKTDNLIIFPTENTTDTTYLGNWQIGAVNSNTNLTLAETSFNLETTGELNYVIGNETRYDLGGSVSAHIEYPPNTTNPIEGEVEAKEGFFYFYLVYFIRVSLHYFTARKKG